MRPFDDEVGTIHRRKEPTIAQWPMIAATHPRAGDPNDSAEDEVCKRDKERRVGESPQIRKGAHRHQPLTCMLRQVTASSAASTIAGTIAQATSATRRDGDLSTECTIAV